MKLATRLQQRPALRRRNGTALHLSQDQVRSLIPGPTELVGAVTETLAEIGRRSIEVSPKSEISLEDGTTARAMKAIVESQEVMGVKWITGHPHNAAEGLPTIHALMILSDLRTGVPLAIMDAAWITAMRTAACTAVSAQHLAREDAATLGLVACGLQGRSNLVALAETRKLSRVVLFDCHRPAAERLAHEAEERYGLEAQVLDHPVHVALESDILVTSAPIMRNPKRPLGSKVLRPGSFICPLDFDSSLTRGALERADRFIVDDSHQVGAMRREGYLRRIPRPHADLGQVVAGLAHGRTRDDEITIGMNLGIAPLDLVVARLIYDRAEERGIGTSLPL